MRLLESIWPLYPREVDLQTCGAAIQHEFFVPIQKGVDIMIIKRSIDEISPELTKEQMEQLEKAEQLPITFDEDCPEFTDEMAEKARESISAWQKNPVEC